MVSAFTPLPERLAEGVLNTVMLIGPTVVEHDPERIIAVTASPLFNVFVTNVVATLAAWAVVPLIWNS